MSVLPLRPEPDDDSPRRLPFPDFASEPNPTVAEVIAAYLRDCATRHQAGEFSLSSLNAVKLDLPRFGKLFGSQRITDCRKRDLLDFLFGNPERFPGWKPGDPRNGRPWGNCTRKRLLAEILACFNWAADDGELIARSPYKRPKNLKLRTQPRREASPTEYVLLMRKGSRSLRRPVFFLRRIGARPCEMREATWEDVDLELGLVLLFENKTLRATGRGRAMGLDRATLRFLRNLRGQAKDQAGPIFRTAKGRPWTCRHFCQTLRLTLQRAGVDPGAGKRVTAYCFRHSWTTRALERGIGDRQIADQLGHSSTAMINWYNHAKGKATYLRAIAEEAMRRDRRPKAQDT